MGTTAVSRRAAVSTHSIKPDFDRLALLDDEGWTANNHYYNALLKYVPQSCANALDIGCGTEAFAREWARRCSRVVALDSAGCNCDQVLVVALHARLREGAVSQLISL
jgi:ubiquinone/menaquinone biosynthesis C-methylase UbiE